nr:MAG: hypothetical protein [Marsupenaeus japonicus endogenous nimavirus]
MYNIVKGIISSCNIQESKEFIRSQADVIIIILNKNSILIDKRMSITKHQKFIKKTYISTLLSTIAHKRNINEALFNFSCCIQNETRTKKEFFMVIKDYKHVEIYSYKSFTCDTNNVNKIECACEWKTKPSNFLVRPRHKKNKNIKSHYVFVFTSQYIPSILQQFIDNSMKLTIRIIYVTTEKESTNVNLDQIVNHLPDNCIITVLIQRLKN